MREATISLTSLLICACASSPPVRYFILDPVPPAREVAKLAADPVQIVSVHLPPALDRRQLVREEAPNKLTVSKEDRWGAPLADMTQRVLSQDLMLRLSPGRVVLPGEPAPAGTKAISVDVLEFGINAQGTMVLDGNWSIVPSGSDVAVASYHFQLTRAAVHGDSAAQAHGMSVLLGQLADSMVAELSKPA
jgi:uncharacterized lipoprotein YmbA